MALFYFSIYTIIRALPGYNSNVVNKVIGTTYARAVITGVYKINIFGGKGGETNAVTNFIVINGNNGAQISGENTASNHQSFSVPYTAAGIQYHGATILRGNSTTSDPHYWVCGSWSPNQFQ